MYVLTHSILSITLLGLLGSPALLCVEATPSATISPDQQRRHDLAQALVLLCRNDEVIFQAVIDQGLPDLAHTSGPQHDAGMQAAWRVMHPTMTTICTDAFASSCSEETLRGAIAFFASDAGQRLSQSYTAINTQINSTCTAHWGEWQTTVRTAWTSAAVSLPPAKGTPGF